ncbi:MAG: FecR domain-containing protein, partial [Chitinophagaceae bacterium]|nr:FecR domain-containing protein [Rubrivivax sp.]
MTTVSIDARRLAVLLGGVCFALAASATDVGHVSLLIGEARVVRADGTPEVLQRGAQIRVGDRIETSANGHVHMRFVDNAAVSVRPDSSLEVQAYRFDVLRPESNEVKFRVEKGTSRSISGAATDLDKSRFRLNTPIAAIGVRGTDFIVQTDPTGVRATVSDGAIVVGALGAGCSAAGLGPCSGAQVRELSADMGRLMAEVRPNDQATRILPAADLSVATAASRIERSDAARPLSPSAAHAIGLAAAEPTPG